MIEQLSSPDAKPTFHVNRRIADELIRTEQCTIVEGTPNLRKTPKYQRLTEDGKVSAGRPFAWRGLSAQVGPVLARAVRRKEHWGLVMLAHIQQKPVRDEAC